jgi:hypothetical protein
MRNEEGGNENCGFQGARMGMWMSGRDEGLGVRDEERREDLRGIKGGLKGPLELGFRMAEAHRTGKGIKSS